MCRLAVLPLAAALLIAGCAHDRYGYGYGDSYPDYAYAGDDWGGYGEDLDRLDPWLAETDEGREIVDRSLGRDWHREAVRALNIRFRRFADTDRDLRLTDDEIRLALVRCATHGWSW